MNRRRFLVGGLAAAPLAISYSAAAKSDIAIGDMHFHLFFVGPRTPSTQPLARNMAAGGVTLASWSLVGDMPWLTLAPGGFKQKGAPRGDEPVAWLKDEMARVMRHIDTQGLKVVHSASDVDRALAGEPRVVLSVEGATFTDAGAQHVETAHALGIRQIQLVHYIRNPLADFQTSKPVHNGLTDQGREVLRACQKHAILVDLAHCTDAAAREALRETKRPLIWSHGSVAPSGRAPAYTMPIFQARQLRFETAKMIADTGGVIGLWALGADVGKSVESYTERLLQLADWIGEDHVAFGSDMNALAKPALASFADHRRVVELMHKRGVPERRIRKIAIENYARVLKAAIG